MTDESASMSRDDIIRVLTLELNVKIRCEACLKKVKKVLRKIDGVYQSSVDEALGKVTVFGLMDPETVIKKLQKAGKPGVEVQLENLQLGGGGNGLEKPKDAGSKGQQQQQQQPMDGGGKDQGHGQQQKPKGGAGGGATAAGAGSSDTKMVVPPHQQPTPQQPKGKKFPPPELMAMGSGKVRMPMSFPAAAHVQDTVAGDLLIGGDEVEDEVDDVNFKDDGLDDDPKMRPPNMMGAGMGQRGSGGPLAGMRMGRPYMGGAGMQQGGGGGGAVHGEPVRGMPMGHTHMGGAGMLQGDGGAGAMHGRPAGSMPAAGCFPGGGGIMPVGAEMLPMSQLPLQQQHMAAIMQQQQLMNGHSHHHGHHGHHAHDGCHGYPPPLPPASSYGYGCGRPAMPQYPLPAHYYLIPPQHHPHDNMFSDENPNGCSVT